MNQLATITKVSLLPAVVKEQLNSTGIIQTVKSEGSIALIDDAILELQEPLATAATASEIQKAIRNIFILLNSSRGNKEDISIEIKAYIKYLQGQPLWAIENAVDIVCKKETFRSFAKFFQEVEKQTDPYVRQIRRLTAIKEKSEEDIAKEKALKEAMDNCPDLFEALDDFQKEHNSSFARIALKQIKEHKERKQAAKKYEECNNLGQKFLNKHNLKNKENQG